MNFTPTPSWQHHHPLISPVPFYSQHFALVIKGAAEPDRHLRSDRQRRGAARGPSEWEHSLAHETGVGIKPVSVSLLISRQEMRGVFFSCSPRGIRRLLMCLLHSINSQ